ncbi:hypothetical protein MHU86_10314 [Fragilaria crotonensis]|nr:hypothetical protein MHU86_10314 [Fragilaria crotonensis]
MSSSTDSGDRHRLVKISKISGKWVLIGISATAATGLPFASIPGGVADKLLSLGQTLGENREDAESLRERVRQCNDLLKFIVQNLNHGNCHSTEFEENAISFLDDILDGFYQILEAISVRCDKWSNKNLPKKMWGAKKYKEEFASLKEKLDTYMPILQSGVTVVACQKMIDSKEDVEKTKKSIEDLRGTLRQEFRGFAEDMIQSLQEIKDHSDVHACEILAEIRSLKRQLNESSNHVTNNAVAALEKRIDELMSLVQANAAQSKVLEDEIKELKDLMRSPSWISRVIHSSPSFSTALNGVDRYITATSLTPEQENLTVIKVELLVTKLTPGDAPTALGAVAATARVATFGLVVVPFGVVGSTIGLFCSSFIVGPERAWEAYEYSQDKLRAWEKNTVGSFCHYAVEVTLSHGEVCTLERTAAVSDTAETCENLKSGVHLYWGINEARYSTFGLRHSTFGLRRGVSDVNNSVKLSDLVIFCHRERRKQYDTWNNNCKHFCYLLLQKVFKVGTELTFAEFTAQYNFPLAVEYWYRGARIH